MMVGSCACELFRESFESSKYSVRAGIYGDGRAVAPGDNSVFIDDEESAFANAFGVAIRAVGFGGSALGLKIGEKRKLQVAVVGESFVGPHTVDRDAEKFGVEFRELGKNFIVEGHLIAADRAPVGGIEGENYRAAAEFAKSEALIGSYGKTEFWSGSSRGKNGCH